MDPQETENVQVIYILHSSPRCLGPRHTTSPHKNYWDDESPGNIEENNVDSCSNLQRTGNEEILPFSSSSKRQQFWGKICLEGYYNINRKSLTVAENVEIKVIFGLEEI